MKMYIKMYLIRKLKLIIKLIIDLNKKIKLILNQIN